MVSVIVPCYNQARYLTDAVRSLQAQTHTRWECLIINDGSTDDTAQVGALLAKNDARVRVINQANCGLAGARNRGLEECRGSYVQFLDADDGLLPQKFATQISRLSSSAALAVAYCDYYFSVQEALSVPKEDLYYNVRFESDEHLLELTRRWESGLSIPCHCFLFDARFFTKHRIRFSKRLPNHEDWECWMRVFRLVPKVHFIDEKLAIYRFSASSMSRNPSKMRRGFLMAIGIQRGLEKANDIMRRTLDEKSQDVRTNYRYYNWPSRTKRAIRMFVGASARTVLPARLVALLKAK